MTETADTRVRCRITGCDYCDGEYCNGTGKECGKSWTTDAEKDMIHKPAHYQGEIEVIDYIRDKLTPEGFTEYCCGNVMKYISRWRKKDGVQDLKKAQVYLAWMIESAEREGGR